MSTYHGLTVVGRSIAHNLEAKLLRSFYAAEFHVTIQNSDYITKLTEFQKKISIMAS
jgi:hypothetical protein